MIHKQEVLKVRVTTPMRRHLEQEAGRQGMSMSELVRAMIRVQLAQIHAARQPKTLR